MFGSQMRDNGIALRWTIAAQALELRRGPKSPKFGRLMLKFV
jgi:hypothetical protein